MNKEIDTLVVELRSVLSDPKYSFLNKDDLERIENVALRMPVSLERLDLAMESHTILDLDIAWLYFKFEEMSDEAEAKCLQYHGYISSQTYQKTGNPAWVVSALVEADPAYRQVMATWKLHKRLVSLMDKLGRAMMRRDNIISQMCYRDRKTDK